MRSEKVIYLARNRATPETAKLWKEGWWAVNRIFYGFFEHKQFTALHVPVAKGFTGSHEMHMLHGGCGDADVARKEGPLTVCGFPCACTECMAGNFTSCLMKEVIGRVKKVKTPREASGASALRQIECLQAWAATLKKDQVVAVRADRAEVHLEGVYWLVQLLCKPYTLKKETVHTTDTFDKGTLVVKIHYYELKQANCEGGRRAYAEHHLLL